MTKRELINALEKSECLDDTVIEVKTATGTIDLTEEDIFYYTHYRDENRLQFDCREFV